MRHCPPDDLRADLPTILGCQATDRFQYAHDADGNVLYKHNLLAPERSELYHPTGAAINAAYDPLNRMTEFRRGTLTASEPGGRLDSIDEPDHSQSWALDALGNMSSVSTDHATQTRTHDALNQITGISGASAPAYDLAGNAIAVPRPGRCWPRWAMPGAPASLGSWA